MAWPSGRLSKPSALVTSSSRNWIARQRCQPSSSPAAARQRGLVFERGRNQLAKLFQGMPQCCGCTGTGFAVAFADFGLQFAQNLFYLGHRLGADLRVHHRLAALAALLLPSPWRHAAHRPTPVPAAKGRWGHSLRSGPMRTPPERHPGPPATGCAKPPSKGGNFMSTLGQPGLLTRLSACTCHCSTYVRRLGKACSASFPGLGGQNFNALGQQYRSFTLDLHLVLKVFDAAHPLGELQLQSGQRLLAERCARLGRVALPGHGISKY